jgi:hypothetical protein
MQMALFARFGVTTAAEKIVTTAQEAEAARPARKH